MNRTQYKPFRPKPREEIVVPETKQEIHYKALSRQDFNPRIIKNWAEIRIPKRPPRRTNHISFIYNSYFYIFGGRDINQGKMDDMYRTSLILQEGKDLLWEKIEYTGDSPGKITNHRACLNGNNLNVYGGIRENEQSNSLYIFNADDFNWKEKKFTIEQITPLSGHSMSIVNNSIIIFGGIYKGQYKNTLYIYNIKDNTLEHYPKENDDNIAIPEARGDHSQTSYMNSVYVYGGNSVEGKYFKDMWKFDLDAMQWKEIEIKGEIPKGRHGHTSLLYKNSLFIFGGKTGKIFEVNQFWKFDIEKEKFLLMHDTMLERSFDDEASKTTSSFYSKSSSSKQEQEANSLNANANEINSNKRKKSLGAIKTKRAGSDLLKMNRTAGISGGFGIFKNNKISYEEVALKSPKARHMKLSLIYKMEEEDELFIHQLTKINKETKIEKIKYGILPIPRDGHSACLYDNKMYVFGGDRNTFPFNDLFMFQFK